MTFTSEYWGNVQQFLREGTIIGTVYHDIISTGNHNQAYIHGFIRVDLAWNMVIVTSRNPSKDFMGLIPINKVSRIDFGEI